jgi:hypothetical protein
VALRRQLEAMPDGGVYAITIPERPTAARPAPTSGLPGGLYFKNAKPRSKVLILDANPDFTSKARCSRGLGRAVPRHRRKYQPQHKLTGVDRAQRPLKFEVQPTSRQLCSTWCPAARRPDRRHSGLANLANGRWAGPTTRPSRDGGEGRARVGDAIQLAAGMPKSGHMANSHGKVAAAAVVAQLSGWEPIRARCSPTPATASSTTAT